jgi:hypothetical protein
MPSRLYDRTLDQLHRELNYYRQQLAATKCKDRLVRHARAIAKIEAEIARRPVPQEASR